MAGAAGGSGATPRDQMAHTNTNTRRCHGIVAWQQLASREKTTHHSTAQRQGQVRAHTGAWRPIRHGLTCCRARPRRLVGHFVGPCWKFAARPTKRPFRRPDCCRARPRRFVGQISGWGATENGWVDPPYEGLSIQERASIPLCILLAMGCDHAVLAISHQPRDMS
jgi:hypothetical protein